MKQEIVDLLLCLDSDDFQEKNNTISDIAILLEMNTYTLNGGQISSVLNEYKCLLSEDLISVRLSIEEQNEIIDELTKRISINDKLGSSMFWAISKSHHTVGLPKLIQIIKCSWDTFDDEVAYQSIIALDNFIIFCTDKDMKTKLLPMEKKVIDFLHNKSESTNE